jgi:hypothetical protein
MGSSNGAQSGFTGTAGGAGQLNNLLSSSSAPLPGQNSTAWNNGQQGVLGNINMGGQSSSVGNMGNIGSYGMQANSGGMFPNNSGLTGSSMGPTQTGFTGTVGGNSLQQALAALLSGQNNRSGSVGQATQPGINTQPVMSTGGNTSSGNLLPPVQAGAALGSSNGTSMNNVISALGNRY